jgi:ATP synthase protein I
MGTIPYTIRGLFQGNPMSRNVVRWQIVRSTLLSPVVLQSFVCVLVLAFAYALLDSSWVQSLLLGMLCYLLPHATVWFGFFLILHRARTAPKFFWLLAELLKVVVALILILQVFLFYHPLHHLAFILGLVVACKAYWLILIFRKLI